MASRGPWREMADRALVGGGWIGANGKGCWVWLDGRRILIRYYVAGCIPCVTAIRRLAGVEGACLYILLAVVGYELVGL